MSMLLVMLIVGAGSYGLRLLPLLLADRLKLSRRTEEMLGYAVLAALTTLLVAVLQEVAGRRGGGTVAAAPWIAFAVAGIAALLRQSMTRIVVAGAATYAVLALASI